MRIYGIVLIVLFIVVIFSIYGLSESHFSQMSLTVPATQETQQTAPPPFTPAVQAQLAASHGFQYLVSYTGSGFQPKTLTVKKDETVRFTNNSSENLWVAANGSSGAVYPAGSTNECGQSAFDSCMTIGKGEFWEFTFNTAGTWSYKNNQDASRTGVIVVE